MIVTKVSPVEYAEVSLGVHYAYETAKSAWSRMEAARTELLGMRATKRRIENQIADREADIAADVTAVLGGSASQAAIDRQVKLQIGTDPDLRKLRQELLDQQDDIDGEETNAAMAKAQVEIETARMTELGGYLHYLGVSKLVAARVPTPTPQPAASGSPWD
jgi:hypothetical protein